MNQKKKSFTKISTFTKYIFIANPENNCHIYSIYKIHSDNHIIQEILYGQMWLVFKPTNIKCKHNLGT